MGIEMKIPLFPRAASTFAPSIDALTLVFTAMSGLVVVGVFSLMLYFAIKYHHTSRADRSPGLAERHHNAIEITWMAVPFAIFLGMFFWAAQLYFHMHAAPPDALEIQVVGKQWMWKFQHPDGTRELAELHVPIGKPVRLIMISEDVIHSLFVPAFRIKQDVLPGRYIETWFEATRPGNYRIFCTQYCGTDHAEMTGYVHALTPEQYQEWLATRTTRLRAAGPLPGAVARVRTGEQLFEKLACDHCHTSKYGSQTAPLLDGVYGHNVLLRTGETVFADENYLRESILNPSVKIVNGYEDLMPTFQGRVNEDELLELIAYLKSLGGTNGGGTK
jgi:cytochrome c oxidase subunit II